MKIEKKENLQSPHWKIYEFYRRRNIGMKYSPDEMLKESYIILWDWLRVYTYYHRWRDSVFDLFCFVYIDHEVSIFIAYILVNV